MNIKALIITAVALTSSTAMADTAFSASAHGSFQFGTQAPAPVIQHHVPVAPPLSAPVVRDHRTVGIYDARFDDGYYDRDPRGFRDSFRSRNRSLVTGQYTSNHGPVQLVQYGERITGTYTTYGVSGTIEGWISRDGVIMFRWFQKDGHRGSGMWQLEGRGILTGTFGMGRSQYNGGEWSLTRTR